jgi:DNA-binding NarL/FixJ family response regulator
MTRRLKPDLVVIDIGLPGLNGLDAARQILSENPRQRILIFTEVNSESMMRRALDAGIRGYVLKTDRADDLLAAANGLLQGRIFFTSRMTDIVLGKATAEPRELSLSEREREVLQLVAEGNSTTKISKILCLSPKTVDTHRTNLRRKLQISSTAELVVYAVRNEIVGIPELNFPTRTSEATCSTSAALDARIFAAYKSTSNTAQGASLSDAGEFRSAVQAAGGD